MYLFIVSMYLISFNCTDNTDRKDLVEREHYRKNEKSHAWQNIIMKIGDKNITQVI
jgi:hypothetical protein